MYCVTSGKLFYGMLIKEWIGEYGDYNTPWEDHEDEDDYYDKHSNDKDYEIISNVMGDEIVAYFLIVKESLFTSDDGEEVKIPMPLSNHSLRDGALYITCGLLNITYEDPSWWLTSEGYSST